VEQVDNGQSMDLGFGKTMDRRRVLRLIAGAGAAAVVGGVGLAQGAGAANFFRATTALNLRAKPRLNAPVKLVIPANGIVVDLGVTSNGFRKVSYQGVRGYAYASYLVPANGGSTDPINIIGAAITTTAVNLRYEPSIGSTIIAVVAKGTRVQIGDRVQNGYRQVVANGNMGWIFDDYLAPEGGEGPAHFTTTAAVNLRAQPNTSAQVIMVVPVGAVVADYDLVLANGFRSVEYKGKTGWIYNAYLK
jgi:uncharacterized protein YgiM (DUF1202 family)